MQTWKVYFTIGPPLPESPELQDHAQCFPIEGTLETALGAAQRIRNHLHGTVLKIEGPDGVIYREEIESYADGRGIGEEHLNLRNA